MGPGMHRRLPPLLPAAGLAWSRCCPNREPASPPPERGAGRRLADVDRRRRRRCGIGVLTHSLILAVVLGAGAWAARMAVSAVTRTRRPPIPTRSIPTRSLTRGASMSVRRCGRRALRPDLRRLAGGSAPRPAGGLQPHFRQVARRCGRSPARARPAPSTGPRADRSPALSADCRPSGPNARRANRPTGGRPGPARGGHRRPAAGRPAGRMTVRQRAPSAPAAHRPARRGRDQVLELGLDQDGVDAFSGTVRVWSTSWPRCTRGIAPGDHGAWLAAGTPDSPTAS